MKMSTKESQGERKQAGVCVLRAEAWVCVSTSVSDCTLVCMTNITESSKNIGCGRQV